MTFTTGDFVNRLGLLGQVSLASADTLYLSTGPGQQDTREVPHDEFVHAARGHEVALIRWRIGEISEVERQMLANRCPCKCCSDTAHLELRGMQYEYF